MVADILNRVHVVELRQPLTVLSERQRNAFLRPLDALARRHEHGLCAGSPLDQAADKRFKRTVERAKIPFSSVPQSDIAGKSRSRRPSQGSHQR